MPYHAYIFDLDRNQVGYVRIPRFGGTSTDLDSFAEIIANFEVNTSMIVIDEVDNPGGKLFFMYRLLSFLTPQPLALPMHEVKIWEEDLDVAKHVVPRAEIAARLDLPILSPSEEILAYSRFLISEAEAGRGGREESTHPVHLGWIQEIQPAPIHYSKPIMC